MSSTNRSNASERHVSDYYVTPQKDILDFLERWIDDECKESSDFIGMCSNLKNIVWLDPCAGGDKDHLMSYPEVLFREIGAEHVVTLDIRDDSLASNKGNFLTDYKGENVDITITNPPFNQALEIIRKAFKVTQKDGYVIMLLRLNFMGSKIRKPFWDEFPAHRIYVHHKRMSFKDGGGTDSIEYAHFVWKVGTKGETKIKII